MRKKRPILERYARSEDGRVIIDIAADRVEELYDNYDKTAPYHKKDLDADLADYILNSVQEIGDAPFVIRFRLNNVPEEAPMSRVRQSVKNFFLYMQELEVRELNRMLRTATTLFASGIVVLTASVWVNKLLINHEGVIASVFAEGLTIAAWVALWEALATFLINFSPHRRRIRLCQRIVDSEVLF